MIPPRFGTFAVLVLPTASLGSCAAAPQPNAPSVPSVTVAPVGTTTPLTCADLVAPEDAARALTGADGVTPEIADAVQRSHALEHALLSGAGGLACSWRVGSGRPAIGSDQGDSAYLSVEVLPDAATEWVPEGARAAVPSDGAAPVAEAIIAQAR